MRHPIAPPAPPARRLAVYGWDDRTPALLGALQRHAGLAPVAVGGRGGGGAGGGAAPAPRAPGGAAAPPAARRLRLPAQPGRRGPRLASPAARADDDRGP